MRAPQDLTGSLHGENDLIHHNLVVFRNGENAMSVLPKLMDVIPEARLNLVIYHLKNNDLSEAHELVKDLKPNTPQEYILKGVVHASLGQTSSNSEHLKTAQQYFQLVWHQPDCARPSPAPHPKHDRYALFTAAGYVVVPGG